MMLFGFQAVNVYKISWKKAVKPYWFSLKKLYFCCSDFAATLFVVEVTFKAGLFEGNFFLGEGEGGGGGSKWPPPPHFIFQEELM